MNEMNFIRPVSVVSGTTFTKDQEIAAEKIAAWYNDPNSLVFTLSGSAGTGKTYLLDFLLRKVIRHTVCVTAPTHKAVRVVEKATGRKGKTLQSLHGLRPNTTLDTFDLNNIQFDPLGNEYIKDYRIIIIDECSQINAGLHELNMVRARQYTTKILYVGDHRQLPPVKSDLSPTFKIDDRAVLEEVVRQKDTNPLLDLLELAKADVDKNTSKVIAYLNSVGVNNSKINSKGEGFIILPLDDFQAEVLKDFRNPEFLTNVDYTRYGAWTNNNILHWNNFIRHNIIPDTTRVIDINDLLTGYRTIVNEFGSVVISNSDDYFISTITERMSDDGFQVFVVTLTSLSTGLQTVTSIADYKHPSFVLFKKKINNLYYNAKYATASERSKQWKKYFAFKDKNLLLVDLMIPGHDGRQGTEVKKDIDYGYGLTIHKLQGSTFKHIFVNMRDICFFGGNLNSPVRNFPGNKNAIETRNKLVYTALSRASHKAVILW